MDVVSAFRRTCEVRQSRTRRDQLPSSSPPDGACRDGDSGGVAFAGRCSASDSASAPPTSWRTLPDTCLWGLCSEGLGRLRGRHLRSLARDVCRDHAIRDDAPRSLCYRCRLECDRSDPGNRRQRALGHSLSRIQDQQMEGARRGDAGAGARPPGVGDGGRRAEYSRSDVSGNPRSLLEARRKQRSRRVGFVRAWPERQVQSASRCMSPA